MSGEDSPLDAPRTTSHKQYSQAAGRQRMKKGKS